MPPRRDLSFGIFDQGMNTVAAANKVPDNQVVDAYNMELNNAGYLQKRGGIAEQGTDTKTDRITSLHYDNHNDQIVGSYGITIGKFNLSTNTWDSTQSVTYSDHTWDWASFQGYVIGNDGYNDPYKWSGSAWSILGGTPPKFTMCCVWGARLWVAGNPANPYRLYACQLNNPEAWSGGSGATSDIYIDIDKNEGGAITAIYPFYDVLYVFKLNRLYKIHGSPITDATTISYDPVSNTIGASGHKCVSRCGNDILFLDGTNVRSLRTVETYGDVKESLVNVRVKNAMESLVATTALAEARLFNHVDKNQLWICLPGQGILDRCTVIFVLDYLEQRYAWTRWSGINLTNITGVYSGTELRPYFGRYASGAHVVARADYGNNDNDAAIDGYFITRAFDFGVSHYKKTYRYLRTTIGQTGNQDLTITYGTDFANSITQSLYDGDASLWDVAAWDGGTWDNNTNYTTKTHGLEGITATNVQFKFRNNQANQPFTFYEGVLEANITKQRGL